MHFTFLLASSLAAYNLVVASPLLLTNLTSPQSPAVNDSQSVGFIPPPGGPPGFSIAVAEGTKTLQQDAVILSTLHFIGSLAQQDWGGEMPEARTVYRDPSYPAVAIAVVAHGSGIQRRIVIWGLARLAAHMAQSSRFRTSQAQLQWGISMVGTIRFIDLGTSTSQQEFERYTVMDLSSTVYQTNESATPVGVDDDGVTWDIDFILEEIPKLGIFMGTIASLVQAAQLEDHNIRQFVGSWPHSPWKPLHTWVSHKRPSVFSRNILIRSMLAAVDEGVAQHNTRATSVRVKQNGRGIAGGGYALYPPMPPHLDVAPSFSLDSVA